MRLIAGGWIAIQLVSFSQFKLEFENNILKASSYKELSKYADYRLKVPSRVLLQLRKDMGFKQLRFYCHKKKVGTVFHIMTNTNPLGEAVVSYFAEETKPPRPQACGSYTVLPDDNSTLSQDCTKLGWNGTHADGRWDDNSSGDTHIYQAMRRNGEKARLFYSFVRKGKCDDRDGDDASLSHGDFWAIFAR